jgi:hypothetical protein
MPPRPQKFKRPNNIKLLVALTALLLLLGIILIQYISLHRLSFAAPPVVRHRTSSTGATAAGIGTFPPLGFPYPQLTKTRQLVTSLCCQDHQQLSWIELTAAYTAALQSLATGSVLHSRSDKQQSDTDSSSTSSSILQQFLKEAVKLLAAEPGLLRCSKDDTLLSAWHAAATASTEAHSGHTTNTTAAAAAASTAAAAHAAAVGQQPLPSRRYLLAANFHNSAAVLPNFIAQTLHLALLLPQGHLAVSLYESGSSDTSRLWLTLMHQLLLPLRVPHNVTVNGQLSPRLGLPRIQLLAALRNALLDPWLTQQQQQQQGLQDLQEIQQQTQQQHAGETARLMKERQKQQVLQATQQQQSGFTAAGWRLLWRKAGSAAAQKQANAAAAAAGASSSLSYKMGSGFVPDTLVFSNDVLLCSDDVLRLVMHDAHIACGMDFYTAPWQQQQQQQGQQQSHSHVAGAADGSSTEYSSSSSSSSDRDADDDDDDFFDPDSMQLLSRTASKDDTRAAELQQGHADGLRFYDKVRAVIMLQRAVHSWQP